VRRADLGAVHQVLETEERWCSSRGRGEVPFTSSSCSPSTAKRRIRIRVLEGLLP
jgi:hypothetical protein